MKRVLTAVAALAALTWGTVGFAKADCADKPARKGGKMEACMQLTAEQKEKMKELAKAQKKEMAPLREALKLRKDELRVLVDKKASDKELEAKLAEVAKARDALQQARMKWKDKRAALLTPLQRAQKAVGMGAGHGKGKGKGMGPGKGRKCRWAGDKDDDHGKGGPSDDED